VEGWGWITGEGEIKGEVAPDEHRDSEERHAIESEVQNKVSVPWTVYYAQQRRPIDIAREQP
jgi:hypothetical protein